jgi:hypothetical protein
VERRIATYVPRDAPPAWNRSLGVSKPWPAKPDSVFSTKRLT